MLGRWSDDLADRVNKIVGYDALGFHDRQDCVR